MQNIEKLVDKCANMDNEIEKRREAFMQKIEGNTGKSRKAVTEDTITEALDIIDSYRHDYNRDLQKEKKFLQIVEAMQKKTYKLVKRYYTKKWPTDQGLEGFVQSLPEYGFRTDDEDLNDIIVGKEAEDYIQSNDDYIAVTRTYGNQLSFYSLIEKEIEALNGRGFRLQAAAKTIRHEQGNFG